MNAGWFSTESEAVRAAVHEFVAQGKPGLIEREQLADMEWAVVAAATRPWGGEADTRPLLHLHEFDAAHLPGHFGAIHDPGDAHGPWS